MLKENLYLRFD